MKTTASLPNILKIRDYNYAKTESGKNKNLKKKKQDKKIDHLRNLDINSVSDYKTFWQIVKPLFLNKVKAKPVTKWVGNKKDDWRWKLNYQNI